jgi:hypothetical protein
MSRSDPAAITLRLGSFVWTPDRSAAVVGVGTIRDPEIEEGAMVEGYEPTDEFEVVLETTEASREFFAALDVE